MEFGLVALWWLVFVCVGVVGFPIAAVVFRSFPDRGAGFALPIALLGLFVVVYWVGHISYGSYAVLVGIGIVGAGAVVCWRQVRDIPRRYIRDAILVFTVAYFFVIAVRSVDPSIQPAGGEKFLDYGLLNSVLRSSLLPPQDMWFAGEPVQYYYGGYVVTGILTTITGTPGSHAYNLALAGFYGMLVIGAYSLAAAISDSRGGSPRRAGVLGAFFVGFASNVVPAVQAVLALVPRSVSQALARQVAEVTALDMDALLVLRGQEDFLYYWWPSRVIPGTINEFPLFAWLNGDLQAHMMSTPFLVLLGAILFAYYRTPGDARMRRGVLVFGLVPPLIGSLVIMNTWDFPSALGLVGVTLLVAPAHPLSMVPSVQELVRRRRLWWWAEELGRLITAGIGTGIVAVTSTIWAAPFVYGPVTGSGTWEIALVTEPSGLVPFLLVHGWFVLLFGVYLWSRVHNSLSDPKYGLAIALGIGAGMIVTGVVAVGLILPVILGGWLVLRRDDTVGFETVLVVTGACIVLLVEFLYVSEQAGPGRWNTVFKSYMHVWVFWAIAAGCVLSSLISVPTDDHDRLIRQDTWKNIVFVVLIVSVSMYGVIAIGVHFDSPAEPTLDATTWASESHPADMAAITWLNQQPGHPHLVSVPGCYCHQNDRVHPYRWVNAPSTFTGLPTVAGWSHQIGYRGSTLYMERVDDVETIYTGTPDEQQALLAEYDVRFVWVSENERVLYDEPSFEAIDAVHVAYENDAVTIYEVNHTQLPESN